MDPQVTIITPVYNQEKYIEKACESVLNQTWKNFEHLIIDDGSTDNTTVICEALAKKDERIRYIKQPQKGPAAAKNHGLKIARGRYICFCDSDDLMSPQKLEVQLNYLESHPKTDIVYTSMIVIDEKGNPLSTIHGKKIVPENFLSTMLFRNVIPGGPITIMAKSKCFQDHQYNEQMVHAEDYELMLRLAHHYTFDYIDTPLSKYRRHKGNLTNRQELQREGEKQALQSYSETDIISIVNNSNLSGDEKQYQIGKILYNMEEYHKAREYLARANLPLAEFYLGNCAYLLNDFDNAIKHYKNSPSNPEVYNNLGVTYKKLGSDNEAIELFKRAQDLNPSYQDPQHNLTGQGTFFTFRELRHELIPYTGSTTTP